MVEPYPSEKYESQLGWWHSQYMESHKSHVPNHQPDIVDPHLQTKIETAGFLASSHHISSPGIHSLPSPSKNIFISDGYWIKPEAQKNMCEKPQHVQFGGSRSPTLPGEYWTNPTHPTCDHEWRWHRQQIANSCLSTELGWVHSETYWIFMGRGICQCDPALS